MNIPFELQKPHDEINEDGKVTHHPGYVVRKCDQCGKDCLAAVEAMSATCGMHDGKHGA
jgi:hypothetical protein